MLVVHFGLEFQFFDKLQWLVLLSFLKRKMLDPIICTCTCTVSLVLSVRLKCRRLIFFRAADWSLCFTNHVACISARQIASAAATVAISSTISTGQDQAKTQPIPSQPVTVTQSNVQVTHPTKPLAKRSLLASKGRVRSTCISINRFRNKFLIQSVIVFHSVL